MNSNDYQLIMLIISVVTVLGVAYLVVRIPRTNLKTRQRPVLIDTSVLMDGRITAVAGTGFMGGSLVIPRSVVGELQLLADGGDSERRARARRGLDIVSELQQTPGVEVEILQDGVRANEGVDNRLLSLAKRHNAAICTLDYNLNKVAVVEGIQVLNINELAQSLRMSHLPGERIMVELTQKGQDSHQGVGHLADGTMVVVEQAHSRIGQTLEVEVIRSLQTAAGRMMFARIVEKRAAHPTQVSAKVSHVTPKPPQRPNGKRPQPSDNAPQKPQRQSTRNSSPRKQSRRAPSSREREAAFIDLVDKQS